MKIRLTTTSKKKGVKEVCGRIKSGFTPVNIMDNNKLYEENEKLVYFVVNKYFKKHIYDEDFIQVCKIGLWKACVLYDPTRGTKISTFAVKIIYTEALKYLRLEKQYQKFNFVDNQIDFPEGSVSIFDMIEDDKSIISLTALKVHELCSQLDKEQKDIMHFTIQGLTQQEQSKILGISQSAISRKLRNVKILAKEIF